MQRDGRSAVIAAKARKFLNMAALAVNSPGQRVLFVRFWRFAF
jgi:hypothetical protein